MIQLIDIGVNMTNKRLFYDVEQVIEDAVSAGVEKMVVTGASLEHSKMAISLCQRFPQRLLSTCGVHPHDASGWTDDSLSQLRRLASNDCVRAIGETGLDFNRDFSPRDTQLDVFQQQLEFASEIGKPVFLHQRDAFETFHGLLKEYRHGLYNVVAHCFTDNRKALFALLDLDCHIGVTGWICDERRGLELQSLVGNIPCNRLMLETDAPYLLPRDLPQKPSERTNYPHYLPHILHTVARHQKKPAEQLAQQVYTTTCDFFGLQA